MKRTPLLLAAGLVLSAPLAHAATVIQSTNATSGVYWNTNTLWGGSAPTSGNNYETKSGFAGSATVLGASFTGTLRDNGTTFLGDSLKVVAGTRLLLKQSSGTSSANLILDGGIVQYGPDSGGSATLGGTLQITANSVLGPSAAGTLPFTISSAVTGSFNLRVAADSAQNIFFNGDLSGFTGTLQVGGGSSVATLNFAQDYNLPGMSLAYGGFASLDKLNLTNNLTLGAFTFGPNTLPAGTYDTTQLNGMLGNGSQFTGPGFLTVVPEPSALTAVLGGLGMLVGFGRRQRRS